ncbi:MAG: type III-B CRISPR module RAMP protein Cmr6, partial [Opitutaceae bacterium]|nr:type III-B CRISPR module RAMP protein Cmr6 [Opitutaceae bacterium]
MSKIPLAKDYAEAVGVWCDKIENRSLLFDKFVFPKTWGDTNADTVRSDNAHRYTLMRITTNGREALQNEAADLRRKANKPDVVPDRATRLRADAEWCDSLANPNIGALDKLRAAHTARFLELLRATYTDANLRVVTARLEGRLAINLAEGLIQNGGINLDRIFGLPLINGSSIKGVARSAALEELKNATAGAGTDEKLATFVRVFGVAESDWKGDLAQFADIGEVNKKWFGNKRLALPLDQKGATVFLQATPANAAQIVVDITNVHTPDYYQYEGILEKIKKERDQREKQKLERKAEEALKLHEHPQPNYFPAVERGAEFAFPILLNGMSQDTTLLAAAEGWLKIALEQRGLGAKTAAGYGWFSDISAEIAE